MANGSSDSAFFNRVGHVEILADGEVKKYYDLDFKFNIRKNCLGAIVDRAKIGILGLNRDTVNWLSTYMCIAAELKKHRFIKVYAGYESSGEQLIFAGDILKAQPSQPVDNWMNIEAQTGGWLRNEILSIHTEPKKENDPKKKPNALTMKKLILLIGKAMGKGVEFQIKKDKVPELDSVMSSFDANGNWLDIINRFNLQSGLKLLVDAEKIRVCHVDNSKIAGTRRFMLSEDTGMIGVPEYQWPYVKFRCLLNPAMKMFDEAMIYSKMVPRAYDSYYIRDITYVGQFRGNPWYMECEGMRDEQSDDNK